MAATFNVIYTNNGPRSPGGSTPQQTVAGLSNSGVYLQNVPANPQVPLAADPYAAAVIQSNGEDIGNAKLKNNPLPPGRTK